MRRSQLLSSLLGGLLALMPALARAKDPAQPLHVGHAEHGELAGDEPASDHSLYTLPGHWLDQSGRSFELKSLRGSPVLLVLFYGTCDSVCPIVVRDAKRVEAMLSAQDLSRTRFVLVTIDPKVDTPERLLAYARKHELDLSRWTLLNGPPEQVRVLANVLGVKYRPTGAGQYSHTIRINVLDQQGNAVEHADGLARPLEPIAARIASLLASESAAPAK